ncbi:PD-(D/E)XK nuclease family protein [Legionella dresdenensis]|uniref:PD-(D/E)XK nuclease family protein n=1 Tax=Legionella dresdenensis TaxID=450200 RepID=A0ABV8CFR8_9GAMM
MTDRTAFFDLMAQGAIVITPNNHLAYSLLEDFLNSQSRTVLEKPCCIPYQQYLQLLFRNYSHQNPQANLPILLTQQQVRFLWAEIIKQDFPVNQGLIDEIQEAWNRCIRWQQPIDDTAFGLTAQTRQFQLWAQCFQRRLDELNAITTEQIADYLIQCRFKATHQTQIWYCFDDYTPQQQSLQSYLNNHGAPVLHLDLADQQNSPLFYSAADELNEYSQLIAWLERQLASGKQNIGVVLPDLEERASLLNRLLLQKLPETSFNIAYSQPLFNYELVAHALNWLSIDGKTLTNHQARLLLQSPYSGSANSEMLARAEALQSCCALQEQKIDMELLLGQLNNHAPKLCELLKAVKLYPDHASPSEWTELFKNRLFQFGFPGDYPLTSAAYQCYNRLLTLFDDLQQFGFLNHTMTCAQALDAISNLAKTTPFQPEKSSAPIQITSLLEAAGTLYDSLWVTGMTDENIPQKSRLSAFIPIELQRQRQMPHADLQKELRMAQKTLQRFKNSSANTLFSFSQLSKDKVNLPTPLLTDLPAYIPEPVSVSSAQNNLEMYHEEYLFPLLADETTTGGSALLANQAKCPFRAFAAHRLHAKDRPVSASDGPDRMERGQIIHKVMELLWQDIQDQNTLLQLTDEALEQKIRQAIHNALSSARQLRPYSFSSLIQQVETARLTRLVEASFEWDKQRPPFSIAALEQEFNLQLGDINFKLRIDRLDHVENGKKWVIDYKSSLPTGTPWVEDRPKEPQLLLYALLDETINTIVFNSLKHGQLTCKGFSEETKSKGINAIKDDESWHDYREKWREQLQALVNEYASGFCAPNPITATTCQQCDFNGLCRYRADA